MTTRWRLVVFLVAWVVVHRVARWVNDGIAAVGAQLAQGPAPSSSLSGLEAMIHAFHTRLTERPGLGDVGGGLLAGLVFGAVLGACEWLVLRHVRPRSHWWIVATALGAAVSTAFVAGLPVERLEVLFVLSVALPSLGIAIAQSITLRFWTPRGWTWLVVSIAASAMVFVTSLVLQRHIGQLGAFVLLGGLVEALRGLAAWWILVPPRAQVDTSTPIPA